MVSCRCRSHFSTAAFALWGAAWRRAPLSRPQWQQVVMERVAVVGASARPERYSHQDMQRLLEHGHQPLPVSPRGGELLGQPVVAELADLQGPVDRVTVYLAPERQQTMLQQLQALRPRRVIFNPGAENPDQYEALRQAGIEVEEACTLVLLSTGQF